MAICLASERFPSKKSAAARVREILYRYPLGATLTFEDELFIACLLDRHPERERKVGCGVASFQVEDNGPSRGFWLTRFDGTRTDFSYLSCLSAPTHRAQVMDAMRAEVMGQTAAARATAGAHVHHVGTPFARLVEDFLGGIGLPLDAVEVTTTIDGDTTTRLLSRDLACRWREYHADRASLQALSPEAHRRAHSKEDR